MAKTVLPVPPRQVTAWLQPYRLSEVVGSYELLYNYVLDVWTLNFFDESGAHAAGPVVVNASSEDLLCGLHHLPSIPPGTLTCRSSVNTPRRYGWEEDAQLVYDNLED